MSWSAASQKTMPRETECAKGSTSTSTSLVTHHSQQVDPTSDFPPCFCRYQVKKTPDDGCETEVEGLKENMTYQFRVRAVNKAGPSLASEPTDNHICKHRNRECQTAIKEHTNCVFTGPQPHLQTQKP